MSDAIYCASMPRGPRRYAWGYQAVVAGENCEDDCCR